MRPCFWGRQCLGFPQCCPCGDYDDGAEYGAWLVGHDDEPYAQ